LKNSCGKISGAIATTTTIEGASENDKTCVTGGTARETRARGTAGRLFEAWKSVAATATRRVPVPSPIPRRRREDAGGDFRKLARKLSRRFFDVRQDFKARAAITSRTVAIPAEAYEAATNYLSDTLDQLTLLNNDADSDSNFDDGFGNNQNHISPQL
jgi:hypothetical protein